MSRCAIIIRIMNNNIPERQIRAYYNDQTIRVYQAYSNEIADSALANGTFVSPPFLMNRMTWIKPSFLWMMYRSRWGRYNADQKRILAIDISREGFAWAISHSCLSYRDPVMSDEEWKAFKKLNPVRIQWDPERDIQLNPLAHCAIQIGLQKAAVRHYVHDWIVQMTDVTPLAHQIRALVKQNKLDEAKLLLPEERIYTMGFEHPVLAAPTPSPPSESP